MTNELRARFEGAACSSCAACGATVESVIHVLRDCLAAQTVWQAILKEWVAVNVVGSSIGKTKSE